MTSTGRKDSGKVEKKILRLLMTRASFCCSNKARKLHLFSAKVAVMRCKLHLCAHLTVKDLKQPILHAKIEKVPKSCMQKSKKLQKVAI